MRNIAALVVKPFQFLIIFPFAAIWNKWCCFHQNHGNCVISFFRKMFDNGNRSPQNGAPLQKPQPQVKPVVPVRRGTLQNETPTPYKKGDVIGGSFEVLGILGKGGFGIVYLVNYRKINEAGALKTFRDELLRNVAAREAFKKVAILWVNLEEHPFIVAARSVTEISGRLFVRMDYLAPDEFGRVTLADHLARASGCFDENRTLKWAIQFCMGMEHAQARGIKCHRDIKPANILITQDGTLSRRSRLSI